MLRLRIVTNSAVTQSVSSSGTLSLGQLQLIEPSVIVVPIAIELNTSTLSINDLPLSIAEIVPDVDISTSTLTISDLPISIEPLPVPLSIDTLSINGLSISIQDPLNLVEPVIHLPLNGDTNDVIGANDGVINGNVGFTPFLDGQAATFDGVNDWINISASPETAFTDGFSCALWVKWNSPMTSAISMLVEVGNNQFRLDKSNSSNRFETYVGGNQRRSQLNIEADQWYHFAVTYDGIHTAIYLNGVLLDAETNTNNLSGNQEQIRIGSNDTGGQDFSGLMSDVRFYNVGLTPEEVSSLFESFNGADQITLSANSLTPNSAGESQDVTITQTDLALSTDFNALKQQDLIIDTDANNEIDDQNTLAYGIGQGDVFNLKGITVCKTSNGGDINAHVAEAQRVVDLMDMTSNITVYTGATGDYNTINSDLANPTHDGYEAVDFIISEAANYSSSNKLLIAALGKLTNIALAVDKDPSIVDKIKVIWLGSNYPLTGEYNFDNDTESVNYILGTNVEFEMCLVRGNNDGADDVLMYVSEVDVALQDTGNIVSPAIAGRSGGTYDNIGDYLIRLFDDTGATSRSLYDAVTLAVFKNPEWGTSTVEGAPSWNGSSWVTNPSNPRTITLWDRFDRDAIIADFYNVLRNPVYVESPLPTNEWLSTSLAGNTLTITTTANSGAQRSSKVVVSSSTERKVITVTQSGSDGGNPTASINSLAFSGGEISGGDYTYTDNGASSEAQSNPEFTALWFQLEGTNNEDGIWSVGDVLRFSADYRHNQNIDEGTRTVTVKRVSDDATLYTGTNQTYTVQAGDVGEQLYFIATPTDINGNTGTTKHSAITEPIIS